MFLCGEGNQLVKPSSGAMTGHPLMEMPLAKNWTTVLLVLVSILIASHSPAAVLFTDNFDIPDTSSLDGSIQTGRHTGILASDLVLRSGGTQMAISSQQVDFFKAGS